MRISSAFLEHIEIERYNSRTRNVRVAAMHLFFFYTALRYPEHSGRSLGMRAVAVKRLDRILVTFLLEEETAGLARRIRQNHGDGEGVVIS